MSHVSGPVGLFTVPKKPPHRPQTTRGSGSGMTPETYENSSIFEPVSKATKAMKIGPKATQNHEKSTLESQEIQYLPCHMHVFQSQTPKFRPKNQQKKQPGNRYEKNFFV